MAIALRNVWPALALVAAVAGTAAEWRWLLHHGTAAGQQPAAVQQEERPPGAVDHKTTERKPSRRAAAETRSSRPPGVNTGAEIETTRTESERSTAGSGPAPRPAAVAPSPRPANRPAGDPQPFSAEGVSVDSADRVRIYSASDADVAPPALSSAQQLWSIPSSPRASDRTTIEIVVDERGGVESAKSVGEAASLADTAAVAMSLSAAKAWRFRPAIKDGRPVKYRQIFSIALR
jgi:hypothetical protein